MKVCSRCKVSKNLSDFFVDPRYRLGVTGHCKVCKAEVAAMHKDWNSVIEKPPKASKRCIVCKVDKPIAEFHRLASGTDGYNSKCKPCKALRSLKFRMDPAAALKRRLRGYGMTPADLHAMIEAQSGLCAVCRREFSKPYIDHDHATGGVRALLCARCNNWLAAIEHPTFMPAAISYLESMRGVAPTFYVNARWVERRKFHKAQETERRSA